MSELHHAVENSTTFKFLSKLCRILQILMRELHHAVENSVTFK